MSAKKRKPTKKSEISFLEKLYAILSKDDYSEYIHWSPDGLSVIISDPIGLTKKVLPEFYKQNNFSSFVRQLNMYNFKKIKTSKKGEQIYMHKEFNESKNPNEIKLIKKRKPKTEPMENENLTNFKNCIFPNEDKEYVQRIEQIEILDEDSKIKEYKTILKNEELTNLVNVKILHFLINKSREKNDRKRLIDNEINNLKNQNINLMKQVELMKNKIEAQNKISKEMKGMIMFLSLLNNKKIQNAINLDLENIKDFEKEFDGIKKKFGNEIENPFNSILSDSEEEIELEEEEEEEGRDLIPNINFFNPNNFSQIPSYIYNHNMYSSYLGNNIISRTSRISIESDYNYDRKSNIMNYENINNVKSLEGFNNEFLKQFISNPLILTNSNNINININNSLNNSLNNNLNNNLNNSIKIQDSIIFLKNQSIPNILNQGYLYKKNNTSFYEKRFIIIDSTPKLLFIDPEKKIIEGEILLEKSLKVVLINKKEFELVTKDKIYKFKDNEGNAIFWQKIINDAINMYSK